MRQLIDEFGSGLRGLLRSPGFAFTAIVVLALGIGANTAVFSIVNALLLTPPPFDEPGALVMVNARSDANPGMFPGVSLSDFDDFRMSSREFEDVAYFSWTEGYDLVGGDQPERVSGAWISHNLFSLLGVNPQIGRSFQAADDRAGAPDVVVISNSLWQRRFGADRSVLGRSLTLDGRLFTIVGVMPPGFRIGGTAELWLPVNAVMPAERRADRSARARMLAIGRLRSGSDIDQARTEMVGIASRLALAYPRTNTAVTVRLVPFDRWNTGELAGPAWVLTVVVALVLLIACANLANLLLARMPSRRHEMAVRASLGAARPRLIRMLLLESLALAAVAGVAGLALAAWGIDVMNGLAPGQWTGGRVTGFAIDGRVLGFTALLSVVTTLVFGAMPALRLSRVSLQDVMKQGGGRTGSGPGRGLRGVLVVCEIALALVLLGSAGMLLRSLATFRSIDLGFDTTGVLTFRTELPESRYPDEALATSFATNVLDALRRDPRVVQAAAETRIGDYETVLFAAGSTADPGLETPPLAGFAVSDDYFATRRINLVRGRDFSTVDRTGAPFVAIVNEGMAAHFWPNQNPLGREFRMGEDEGRWYTVVGVIADVRQPAHTELTITPHSVYVPLAQNAGRSLMFYARSRNEPESIATALPTIIGAIDPDQPISSVRTLEQIVSTEASDRASMATLLALFGAIGLALAVIGIYSVMSYAVTARTREIAIRMGLGARSADMRRLILGEGGRLTAIGVGIGLIAMVATTRLLVSSIEFVEGFDPLVIAIVSLVLAGVALVACWVPARRAMKVQPMDVLRGD